MLQKWHTNPTLFPRKESAAWVWVFFYLLPHFFHICGAFWGTWRSCVIIFWRHLVGGLEHVLFSHALGISSSQLILIFFRGVQTTNQLQKTGMFANNGAIGLWISMDFPHVLKQKTSRDNHVNSQRKTWNKMEQVKLCTMNYNWINNRITAISTFL